MKYFALFDWDKTVRKNYAYDIFVDTLVENKVIDSSIIEVNNIRRNDYLTGKITHDQLAEGGMEVYRKIY